MPRFAVRAGLMVGVVLVIAALQLPAAARAQDTGQAGFTLLLPLVTRQSGGTPQPQPIVRAALFLDSAQKIGTGSLIADGQGGLHTAYAQVLPLADHPQAVYLYCAPGADCGQSANWHGVALADDVDEVQLAVTTGGQPRLLIRTRAAENGYDNDYLYAACDIACTDPAQWESTFVVSTYGTSMFAISDFTSPQRYFTLDPQGRPRFIYFDRNYFIEPDHIGVFYVYCDADCTSNPAGDPHWFETQISLAQGYQYEVFKYPALAFTPAGEPRVLADVITLNTDDSGIYYAACDDQCDDGANWQRVRLADRGSGTEVSWDLEVDGQGRPRAAYFDGSYINNGGEILYYVWCDGDCLNGAAWHGLDLELAQRTGKHPDLELDAQGRPRIAHMVSGGGGLGYAWCNANCGVKASWQEQVLETEAALSAAWPVARPGHCDAGFWDSKTPVLTLDPAGQPRISYDSAYETRCWYDDPTDNLGPYLKFHQLWHTVRVQILPKP